MASAALSRRLGEIVGTRVVDPDERALIVEASQHARVWTDLPAEVRGLIEQIKARPTLGAVRQGRGA